MATSEALRFLEIKLLTAFKSNKELPVHEQLVESIIHFYLITAEKFHNDDPTVNKLLSEIRELAYTTAEQVDDLESAFLGMSLRRQILSLLLFRCKLGDFPSQVKIIERNLRLIRSKYWSLWSAVSRIRSKPLATRVEELEEERLRSRGLQDTGGIWKSPGQGI